MGLVTIFNYKLHKSTRKNKQLMVIFTYKGKVRKVHFGDPNMKEYPGTTRGDNYCTRSYGIIDGQGNPTRNNPLSPNFWSRKVLWNCVGKKSRRS
jgi:hypothetical protein